MLLLAATADVCLCVVPGATPNGILGNSKQSNIKFPLQCHRERESCVGGKEGSGEMRGVRERATEKERARQNTLVEGEKMRCQGGYGEIERMNKRDQEYSGIK